MSSGIVQLARARLRELDIPGQGAGMTPLAEARRRATALLDGTNYFDQLGITELGADSRALARITVELADQLEQERSARRAIQTSRDECLQILASHAGSAIR